MAKKMGELVEFESHLKVALTATLLIFTVVNIFLISSPIQAGKDIEGKSQDMLNALKYLVYPGLILVTYSIFQFRKERIKKYETAIKRLNVFLNISILSLGLFFLEFLYLENIVRAFGVALLFPPLIVALLILGYVTVVISFDDYLDFLNEQHIESILNKMGPFKKREIIWVIMGVLLLLMIFVSENILKIIFGLIILALVLIGDSFEKKGRYSILENASHETLYDSIKWITFGLFALIYPVFMGNILSILMAIGTFVIVLFCINLIKERNKPINIHKS